MKYAVVVLLALAAVNAYGHEIAEALAGKERSISSSIVDAILDFQEQMPCGFPGLGLGPLAPAYMSHKEINLHGDSYDVDGSFTDLYVYGLNDFDIREFKVSAITSRVNFEFFFNKVHLLAKYNMNLNLSGDTKLKMSMNGVAKFAVEGFKVWGRVTYSLGVISGNVRVKSIKVYASLENVTSEISGISSNKYVNQICNEIIEEFVGMVVNENTEKMAELTDAYAVPFVNDIIGERSLADLIGMIGGGGGGGSGSEKVPCVAPTETKVFV